MRVITFYSYKGGTGRTLAVANLGVLLARLGKKAVLVDFDLDGPGLDSKFGFTGLELEEDQKGILDYLLHFQITGNDDISIEEISIEIPIVGADSETLWLIPVGYYLDFSNYSRRLSGLDWHRIFSIGAGGKGVAFFQLFLKKIEKAFHPDFIIIDSQTGISEIAGICTQQLAKEVVVLSNFSAENLKMIKPIKNGILNSKIAKALGKEIDIKTVVSRIPKPERPVTEYQETYSLLLDTPDSDLFFLFFSRELEVQEFVALAGEMKRDSELTQGYLRLFSALDIDISKVLHPEYLEMIDDEMFERLIEASKLVREEKLY